MLTGDQSKLDALINLLEDYEILELARTGLTGLERGSETSAFAIRQMKKSLRGSQRRTESVGLAVLT